MIGLIWKLWSSTGLILPAAFHPLSGPGSHCCGGHGQFLSDRRNVSGFGLAVQAIILSKIDDFFLDPLTELFLPFLCPTDTKLNKFKNMNSNEMPRPNSVRAERSPASLTAVSAPDLRLCW